MRVNGWRESIPAGQRRPVRLIGSLAAILAILLSTILLLGFWRQTNAVQPAADSTGAVLIICSENQPVGQFRILQAGLKAAGYAAQIWRLESAGQEKDNALPLESAVLALAGENGLQPEQIWLLTFADTAAPVWRLGNQIKSAGQIMITPRGLNEITSSELQQWPENRLAAIFAADTSFGEQTTAARDFFEQLTGTDLTLFPAIKTGGFLAPRQALSVTGRILLKTYPALAQPLSLLSVRVLTGVTDWLSDWSAAAGEADLRYRARRQILNLVTCLALSGLLILLIPFGLILAFYSKPVLASQDYEPAQLPEKPWKRWWLLEAITWIPAAIFAAGFGLLLAWIAGAPRSWLLPAIGFLPGSHGCLILTVCFLRHRWLTRSNPEMENQLGGEKMALQAKFMLLTQLIVCTSVLACAGLWSWLTFGTLISTDWPWLVFPALVILNWPAGMANPAGNIGQTAFPGQIALTPWHAALWKHLPFLLLSVWAAFSMGWTGFSAAALLLMVHIWSVGIGKASSLLTGRPGIGSLLQSAAYVSGFLLAPVIAGFQ